MCYSNELYHHGILGMKWGIRRYQPYPKGSGKSGKEIGEAAKVKQRADKLNEKASKKFDKFSAKEYKNQQRANKYYERAVQKSTSLLSTKKGTAKAFDRADAAQRKVDRYEYRGATYYKNLEKKLNKMGMSTSEENRKIGEEYLRKVSRTSQSFYNTSVITRGRSGRR